MAAETKPKEPLITEFAAAHCRLDEVKAPDIQSHGDKRTVMRVTYPGTVDRWLLEGGPGFDEPQAKAIEHVRTLWASIGSQGNFTANWERIGGGNRGPRPKLWEHAEALTQLHEYEREIPKAYWIVFERMCRDDFGAARAADIFASAIPQQIAHAKNIVGFVASLVAQWRGY